MAVEQFFGYIDDPQARAAYQRSHGSLGQINRAMIGDAPKQDIHLWKPLMRFMPDWRASKQGIGDCFHPDTLILGERTKRIRDVRLGDKVLGADGRPVTVISRRTKPSHQPLISLMFRDGAPLRITADHRVVVDRYERPSINSLTSSGVREEGRTALIQDLRAQRVVGWVPASEVAVGDFLLTPASLLDSQNREVRLHLPGDMDGNGRRVMWRGVEYIAREVKSIAVAEGPHEVDDIGVDHEDHAFLANGYVAHNCVSHGLAHALLFAVAVAAARGACGFPGAYFATEVIYGGARVEAPQKRYDGGGDGAVPEYGIQWLERWGAVLREDYSKETGNPLHDYRVYDAKKAKEHGAYGAGGQNDMGKIDAIAKRHPVEASAAIVTLDEFVASITNGYPVAIGCNAGYGDMKRDENGIVRWTSSWAHEQCYIGLRYFKGRIQGRKLQSWGNCVSGPDPGVNDKAISDSSWWVDEADLVKEIRSGSLNAISSIGNFERRDISAYASAISAMEIG